jgi:hypothetical protein
MAPNPAETALVNVDYSKIQERSRNKYLPPFLKKWYELNLRQGMWRGGTRE